MLYTDFNIFYVLVRASRISFLIKLVFGASTFRWLWRVIAGVGPPM